MKATDHHAISYKKAMVGEGIDRHLFCLYVMSRYLKIDSEFLSKVLKEPWRLSTSQTPSQQTGIVDFNKHTSKISGGGGFGPVSLASCIYTCACISCSPGKMSAHVQTLSCIMQKGTRRLLFNYVQSTADYWPSVQTSVSLFAILYFVWCLNVYLVSGCLLLSVGKGHCY